MACCDSPRLSPLPLCVLCFKLVAAMDNVFDTPVPARQGLYFTKTNPSRCLVASMNPAPASAWFLNGSR